MPISPLENLSSLKAGCSATQARRVESEVETMSAKPAKRRILIVDDDQDIQNHCQRILERAGYETVSAMTAGTGLDIIGNENFDLLLFDVFLPDFSGLELLEQVSNGQLAKCPIIVITGHGSIDMAVTAMKLGAADYVQKPLSKESLLAKVSENLPGVSSGAQKASWGAQKVSRGAQKPVPGTEIIGCSTPLLHMMNLVKKAAANDITVMIYGESGTGKELAARAIHALGPRCGKPFIPVDCTALSPSVIESELFGHVKGAFTNAIADRDGLLRRAGGGSVFLDEIVSLTTTTQAKLLRVLQEKTVRPVGSDSYCSIQARVLAASNRDLLEAVKAGDFREDLFYRLDILPIYIPPLRERKDDIHLLVSHFIEKHATAQTKASSVSTEALAVLQQYDWPGNVRQLENTIQRVLVLCDSDIVLPRHLPAFLLAEAAPDASLKEPDGLVEKPRRTLLRMPWNEQVVTRRRPPGYWVSAGLRCMPS